MTGNLSTIKSRIRDPKLITEDRLAATGSDKLPTKAALHQLNASKGKTAASPKAGKLIEIMEQELRPKEKEEVVDDQIKGTPEKVSKDMGGKIRLKMQPKALLKTRQIKFPDPRDEAGGDYDSPLQGRHQTISTTSLTRKPSLSRPLLSSFPPSSSCSPKSSISQCLSTQKILRNNQEIREQYLGEVVRSAYGN